MINDSAHIKDGKKPKIEGTSGLLMALGGHDSSFTSFVHPSDNEDEEDVLDACTDKAIAVVNAPVLIISYNNIDILKAHDRVKVVLALPIGITQPICNVSPDGFVIEVSYKHPEELTNTVRIFGPTAHFNDPGMVAFRKMVNQMEGSDALTGKISIRMPFEVDVVPLAVSIPQTPQCTIVITLKAKDTSSTSFNLA